MAKLTPFTDHGLYACKCECVRRREVKLGEEGPKFISTDCFLVLFLEHQGAEGECDQFSLLSWPSVEQEN